LLLAFLLAQRNCLPDHKDEPQNLGELQIIPIYYTTQHITTLHYTNTEIGAKLISHLR